VLRRVASHFLQTSSCCLTMHLFLSVRSCSFLSFPVWQEASCAGGRRRPWMHHAAVLFSPLAATRAWSAKNPHPFEGSADIIWIFHAHESARQETASFLMLLFKTHSERESERARRSRRGWVWAKKRDGERERDLLNAYNTHTYTSTYAQLPFLAPTPFTAHKKKSCRRQKKPANDCPPLSAFCVHSNGSLWGVCECANKSCFVLHARNGTKSYSFSAFYCTIKRAKRNIVDKEMLWAALLMSGDADFWSYTVISSAYCLWSSFQI